MRIAFLTDQHFPYEDRRAWYLALRIAADFQPDAVPICSDDRDFYSVSSFDKDPMRIKRPQVDLDYWHDRMAEMKDTLQPGWRSGYTRPIEYKPVLGNHNERWLRYMWSHPEIYGIDALEYPTLHEFKKYGFTWTGKADDWEANKEWRFDAALTITHGACSSVQSEMAGRFYDGSLIMGHLHRYNQIAITKPDRTSIFGIQSYCLCDLEPRYVRHPNWQLGVTLITVSDGTAHAENVPFHPSGKGLRAVYRDTVYTET